METTKITLIEAVSEGLLDQDHQAKRHKVLIRDIQQESLKETPPKPYPRNSKKRLWKSPKRKKGRNTIKPWGTTPNHLYIPWMVHTRSIFHPIILPSHNISPWSSQASPIEILRKIRRENRKTKWARVPRVGCYPLTPWVIWKQAERLKCP
jgi:hypothetical protein